jgi:hypothetical protein
MKRWILLGLLFSLEANAAKLTLGVSQDAIHIQRSGDVVRGFSKLEVRGHELSRKLGEPELPVKSLLVYGAAKDIHVAVNYRKSFLLEKIKPMPVQEQPCRCADDKKRTFQYNARAYKNPQDYRVESLGWWRGKPVSRIDISLAKYDAGKNAVRVVEDVEIEHNAETFAVSGEPYKDYLIVVPAKMASGVTEFAQWKTSQGYNVIIEKLETPQITLAGIAKLVADSYAKNGIDFVLMVGDETILPMYKVETSAGQATTDIKYFTLDGSGDYVPDVFYGRVVATSADEVAQHLAKSIEYERNGNKNAQGISHVIGIASDEGYGPSDEEYVQGIEENFVKTYAYTDTHFHQGDQTSNPVELNKSLNTGAAWLFYMGHGSGSSWPSMRQEYQMEHVAQIKNATQIKPIIIDVACANGRLLPGHLGSAFSDVASSDALGAAAYYGGTVNISWHPPAIMARGIAIEHAAKNFKHLGEALFAGQMYLAANWDDNDDVIDNFEWYHLQGDPSLHIRE